MEFFLEDHSCRFFVLRKFSKSLIHIDGNPPRNCAVNFPIDCAESAPMIWYKNTGLETGTLFKYITLITLSEKNAEELYRDYLDQPSIFNTAQFHAIDNSKGKNNRVIFGVRFSENPSFDKIKEILTS